MDKLQVYNDVRAVLMGRPYSVMHALKDLAQKWGIAVDGEGVPLEFSGPLTDKMVSSAAPVQDE